MTTEDCLVAGLAAIDAANAADPEVLVVDGVGRPKEVVHAEHVSRWVLALDPDASVAQLLAARAHHLRRWVSPRSDYPDGRAGYLRWRAAHKARQAAEVRTILAEVGCDPDTIEQVAGIVAKHDLGVDRRVQVHEDALCLTFLELQFEGLVEQLGEVQIVDVLRRTMSKMSPAGLAAAADLPLSSRARRLMTVAAEPQ